MNTIRRIVIVLVCLSAVLTAGAGRRGEAGKQAVEARKPIPRGEAEELIEELREEVRLLREQLAELRAAIQELQEHVLGRKPAGDPVEVAAWIKAGKIVVGMTRAEAMAALNNRKFKGYAERKSQHLVGNKTVELETWDLQLGNPGRISFENGIVVGVEE